MSAEGTTPAMHLPPTGMTGGRGRMSSGSYKNRVGAARPPCTPLPPCCLRGCCWARTRKSSEMPACAAQPSSASSK
jgi:hypothetical protein